MVFFVILHVMRDNVAARSMVLDYVGRYICPGTIKVTWLESESPE